MAAYSPRIVANAFLWKKGATGLSHMKLQKLVFFVHAWSLALKGTPAVSEKPQAWQYGPVFTSLYQELKSYGAQNITALLQEFNPTTRQMTAFVPNQTDAEFWPLFDRVWDRYGKFTALQLSALTHVHGGPWERAYNEHQGAIPDEWLAEYYRNKLTASGQPAPGV